MTEECEGIRSAPCSACPYRKDVPSGVWQYHEYQKLREYDEPTFAQPFAWFACHATPDHACNGWAVVHSNRGHEFDLVALRIRGIYPDQIPDAATEMFASGNEAADHGQADIEDPTEDAVAVQERLLKKYDRLRTAE